MSCQCSLLLLCAVAVVCCCNIFLLSLVINSCVNHDATTVDTTERIVLTETYSANMVNILVLWNKYWHTVTAILNLPRLHCSSV